MEFMKNIQSSYKQKGKIILAVLMLPCMTIACGLAAQNKVITHQVDSGFMSQQENYSTIVYDFYSKYNFRYKLVSIDGKNVQVAPKGTDHYRLKPGLHTVVFEEVDSASYPFLKRTVGYSPYKKDITFESVAGVKYVFKTEDICVCEKKGSSKSVNLFSHYQIKIKEAHSNRIVNNPIDGEFQPTIGKGTRKGLSTPPILHLYDGPELQDDKIARFELKLIFRLPYALTKISGTSIDGSKILYDNSRASSYQGKPYEQFALLPGTYSIELYAYGAYMSGSLSLHALGGNSYSINYKLKNSTIFSSTREYEIYIENVTEQGK